MRSVLSDPSLIIAVQHHQRDATTYRHQVFETCVCCLQNICRLSAWLLCRTLWQRLVPDFCISVQFRVCCIQTPYSHQDWLAMLAWDMWQVHAYRRSARHRPHESWTACTCDDHQCHHRTAAQMRFERRISLTRPKLHPAYRFFPWAGYRIKLCWFVCFHNVIQHQRFDILILNLYRVALQLANVNIWHHRTTNMHQKLVLWLVPSFLSKYLGACTKLRISNVNCPCSQLISEMLASLALCPWNTEDMEQTCCCIFQWTCWQTMGAKSVADLCRFSSIFSLSSSISSASLSSQSLQAGVCFSFLTQHPFHYSLCLRLRFLSRFRLGHHVACALFDFGFWQGNATTCSQVLHHCHFSKSLHRITCHRHFEPVAWTWMPRP